MKKIFRILFGVIFVFLFYIFYENYPKLDLISGFSSKSVASAHFIDGRSLTVIEQGDNDINMIDLANNEINEKSKSVTASVYGFKTRKAIYRAGLGAVLVNDNFDEKKPFLTPKRIGIDNNLVFPYGNKEPEKQIFPHIDYQKLNVTVNHAFDKKGQKDKRTRSLLVIYKDKIIAEKYADGFNKNSKLLGWSMTKSLTATYFGILQKQGFDINQPAPIAQWQKDARKNITINNLLQMNSGLAWEENYDEISDVTKMLFLEDDMSISQSKKSLQFKPNTHWNYSSGTTNLLSGILRKQFNTHQNYLDFWYSALIDKIGMQSMLVETDLKGNYIGSSYGWATTRDWAKFGLLYLHKGNWNGEQLFNESWVQYVTTPTNTSQGAYGAQFWLNAGGALPDVPREVYYADGFQGQRIFIIPSHDMVVVRLGVGQMDFNQFLSDLLHCIDLKQK